MASFKDLGDQADRATERVRLLNQEASLLDQEQSAQFGAGNRGISRAGAGSGGSGGGGSFSPAQVQDRRETFLLLTDIRSKLRELLRGSGPNTNTIRSGG